MTAGERLVMLSGAGSLSAGARLHALAAGANAGAKMVARSGLLTATAGVHLMHDAGGPGPGGAARRGGQMIVSAGSLMSRM